MNMEKNFVSAVVYVHNAEHRVADFVDSVIAILQENFEHSEVICVNDNSSDGRDPGHEGRSGPRQPVRRQPELLPRRGDGHERRHGPGHRGFCLRV